MKKKLLIAAGVVLALIVALLGGLFAYGAAQPREHSISSSIEIAASPDAVWAVLIDVESLTEWMDGVESVEIIATTDDGLHTYKEGSSWGDVTFRETEAVEAERLVVEIVDGEGWGGTWTYVLVPSGDGTTMTVTEDGWVDSAMFRAIMHIVGVDSTLNTVLAATKARVESR